MVNCIRHIRKFALLVPVLVALAAGCSEYEAPDNLHHVDYGTAYLEDESMASAENLTVKDFFIMRDDGVVLRVTDDLWGNFIPQDNQRVYLKYMVVSESETAAAGEELEIKLYYLTDVRSKNPAFTSELNEDPELEYTLGNDPITAIKEMRYSGKYVNFVYEYLTAQPIDKFGKDDGHTFNLLIDDVNATEDQVTVRICHNANGDIPQEDSGVNFRTKRGKEISIDLSSLLPDAEAKRKITINFVWTVYKDSKWETTAEMTKTKSFEPYDNAIQYIIW